MRRIGLALAVLAAIAAAYGLGRLGAHSHSGDGAGRRILYYSDPMHPTYRSNKPGTAPDCGMRLEPVYADADGGPPSPSPMASLPAGTVTIDGATERLMGIRLAAVERSAATRTVRAVGRVAPEDTRVYRVNPGVDGFIRETFNDSVGVMVKKEQKLATYYSPEFLPAASGFLAAIQSVPGAAGKDGNRTMPFPGALSKQGVSSIQGYTDRLRNLGMSDAQIARMAESHLLPESVDIVSPVEGFILARSITAGQHFEHTMEFYRIADLSRVWVVAEVYEREAAYLHPGGMAQVALRDGARRWTARIADSLPQSETGGGTVKVRLEVENPAFQLRPDMLVDVELPVDLPAAVTVPLDALVDSGATERVYVERAEGVFEPREVSTGWRSGDRVEIRRGLHPGERVVVAATFLVDSESRLKAPASQPMPAHGPPSAKPATDPNCGMPVDPAAASAAGNTLTDRGATYYFCSRQCKQTYRSHRANAASGPRGDGGD